jgi:transposase-like protein
MVVMDKNDNDVQQDSQWYVPELIVRELPGGRRVFNQAVKRELIARLRQSPKAIDEVALVNGLRREMVQRWIVPLGRSHHKRRNNAGPRTSLTRLIPVQVQPAQPVKVVAVECELALPKGVLRIKCSVTDLASVIAQLQ